MKVLLRAPLLTNSGYGVHSRQIFEYLYEKHGSNLTVECLRWGMTSWRLNNDDEDGLIGKIMSCSKKIEPPYDITYQLQLPNEWDTGLGKKNIGMSAFVETDRCNSEWVESCNKMSAIIVPSNFVKKTIKRSGIINKKIFVVPEWFNHDILKKQSLKKELKLKTSFNFLMISQLNGQSVDDDRKNIINQIKTFCETFKDDKNVGLILKTNMGKGTTIDRKLTENFLKNLFLSIGKKEFPKVYLLHGNMSKNQIAALYHHPKVKCFMSATRGEGYGLPLIDAAAAGMPVIATNWSGHLQFLESNLFIPVKYNLIDIPKTKVDNRIFIEGTKWANPDLNDLSKKMLSAYHDYDNYKKNAIQLSKNVVENFNSKKIKKLYNEIEEEIFLEN